MYWHAVAAALAIKAKKNKNTKDCDTVLQGHYKLLSHRSRRW
jgi:hypothetical protein